MLKVPRLNSLPGTALRIVQHRAPRFTLGTRVFGYFG